MTLTIKKSIFKILNFAKGKIFWRGISASFDFEVQLFTKTRLNYMRLGLFTMTFRHIINFVSFSLLERKANIYCRGLSTVLIEVNPNTERNDFDLSSMPLPLRTLWIVSGEMICCY